ncbi:MAG: hypothetical protein Q8S75_16090, partial [Nitrospirota bacterium]|nr:hypothetical protein [Nitrospirota bacterium]
GHIEFKYKSVEGSPLLFLCDSNKTGKPTVFTRHREPKPEQVLTDYVPRFIVMINNQNASTHGHLPDGSTPFLRSRFFPNKSGNSHTRWSLPFTMMIAFFQEAL